jgi:YHS domain-containing protein
MSTQLRLAIALSSAFVPGVAVTYDAHQADAPQASTEMARCAQAQPVVEKIIAGGMARLESARQSNSPAEMRTAVDQLQAAFRDIRAQLAPCSAAAAAADPQAGHTMPGTSQTPPKVADPHAGPAMPPAPASPKSPSPKPAPSKPERPQTADPHAGHASEQQPEKQTDPVNGLTVDPSTARKTTYQGQVYYFSSDQTLKEFLQNPTKFAKKPKG